MAVAKGVRLHKRKRKQISKTASSQASAFFAESHWKEIGLPSAKAARTLFWDGLHKVPTCRSALREFDRRTNLNARSYSIMDVRSTLPGTTDSITSSELGSAYLKGFARRGGPDIRILRGYNVSNRKRKRKLSTSKSSTSMGTTTSDKPELMEHLVQHRIYPEDHNCGTESYVRPDNYKELLGVIAKARPANDVTKDDFEKFKSASWQITSKKSLELACSAFQLVSTDPTLFSTRNATFTNIKPMTSGLIPKPTPHYYDGANAQDLDSRAYEALHDYIDPKKSKVKSGMSNDYKATRRAMYWGAVEARAMYRLQSYKGTKNFDNNAYTIVCVLSGRTLEILSSHRNLRNGRIEYHTNFLTDWCIRNSDGTEFKDAVRGWRNIREWARDKRNQFIQEANERVVCLSGVSASNAELDFTQVEQDKDMDESSEDELGRLMHLPYMNGLRR